MQFSRRSLSFAGLSLVAMATLFAACTDDGQSPVGPPEPPIQPPTQMVTVECTASVKSLSMKCEAPRGRAGGASGTLLGEQNVDVKLSSNDVAVTADTFAFDINITNVIQQPTSGLPQRLGVDSLGARSPILVGFISGPVAIGPGGGTVEVANAEGIGTFTQGGQPYFAYPDTVLDFGEVSQDKRWKLRFDPQVENFTFLLMVDAALTRPRGWVDVTPVTNELLVDSSVALTRTVRHYTGKPTDDQTVFWSSSDSTVAKVNSSGVVTAMAGGTAVITASTSEPGRYGTAVVNVKNALTFDALENVTATVAAPGLKTKIATSATIVPATVPTTSGGEAVIEEDGSFRYSGAAGFVGNDSFSYDIVHAGKTISIPVRMVVAASSYWFVKAGATGTADGRQKFPFATVAAAKAAAIGPDPNDIIVVQYADGTPLDGPVVLEAGQTLLGEGIAAAIEVPLNGAVDTIVGNGGEPLLTRTGAGATVTLATNNTLRGLGIKASGGAAVTGSSFVTLKMSEAWVSAAGPALHLTTGDVDADLDSLSSAGSASQGLYLSGVTGKLTAAAGSLSGAAGATVAVIGGTVRFRYPGSVSQASNAPLLSVTGLHADSLTFTGAVDATGGTGLQFAAANGTYTFAGATTLHGGDAGVDVTGGSTGVFSFPNATITNPTGAALNVVASAPTLSLAGTITNNNGRAVVVDGLTGGSVSVSAAVNSGAPGGTGILVQNNTGGTTEFTGGGALSTGTASAVTLSANAAAAIIRFAGPALAITTTTGTGFNADGGGTLLVTGGGKKVRSTGGVAVRILNTKIDGISGAVFDSVSASGGANGIVLQNTTTGVFVAHGGTISGTTGSGVQLTGAAFATLNNLTVTGAGTAAAFSASGSSNVTVTDVSVSATTGPALSLVSSTLNGTFSNLGSSASTSSAVILNDAAGAFTAAAGTLAGTVGGPAIAVIGGSVDFINFGSVSQAAAAALLSVTAGHTGDLNFNGAVTATAGTGLQFNNADGSYLFNAATTLNGGDAGIDILAGSGGSFSFGDNTSVGATTSPSGTAFAINASTPNVVFSGNLRQTNAALLVDITGQALGSTVTFQTGTLQATAGDGIQLSNADGTVNFTGNVTLNGGNAAVDVIGGSDGIISFSPAALKTQTITNPTGEVIRVLNSSPAFTYAGSFSKNSTGTGILVQSSGGTVTITGDGAAAAVDGDAADVTKVLSTTTSNAVNLLSNTGTVTFEGGGLVITTTTGTGFNATGDGTVNVTHLGNTVSSTGGAGVNIQNVDIGASGVAFRSVTATGASSGIALVNTGSTGGSFIVTGVPATGAGSGGTIQTTSGADGAVAGNGVYLENARNVSLSWINFTGSVNHAVRGVSAANFTMHKARMTGTHGSNAAIDESAVFFTNLSGTASITGSNISGAIEDNLRFVNNTGTLNRLVLDGDTVGLNDTANGNDGIYIESGGSAVVNATIQNSRFTSARGDWMDVNVVGTGQGDLVFTGNVLTNNHPNILGGGGGMTIGAGGTSTLTYSITNNTFRDSKGSAIVLFKGFGGGAGTAVMSGTVSGNVIGVNGVPNSASTEGSGIAVTELARGSHTVRIHGNQIRGYNNHGILLTAGGAATSSTGLPAHDGALNATITGNTIAQPGNLASIAAGKNGVHLNAGTNSPDAYNVCLKLGGAGAEANSLTGSGSAEVATATDFRLRNRILTTVRLPGYAGANDNDAAVTSYVQGRNPVSPTGFVSNNVAGGAPGYVGGADCTLP